MSRTDNQISRRYFLRGSAALGAGVVMAPYLFCDAFAASRDRVTIYQNTVADSINPYNQSSGSIYGNWQHVIEPLVELDYAKKAWVGVLAESWDFKGTQWVFKLKNGIKFHNGAPLTSQDVVFSVERMRDQKGGSLQASNFNDVTEMRTPDDQTVIFVTKQPLAVFLDRLRNALSLARLPETNMAISSIKIWSAPALISLSVSSAVAIWFLPATTITGAAKRRSKTLSFARSPKMPRAWRHWNQVRPISSTPFRSMKSAD